MQRLVKTFEDNNKYQEFARNFCLSLDDKTEEQMEAFKKNVDLHKLAWKKTSGTEKIIHGLGSQDYFLMDGSVFFDKYPCNESWVTLSQR